MNSGEVIDRPRIASLEEELFGFLADGLNISWEAAQILKSMSPEEVAETTNGVLAVVDENGPEDNGVIARSEWLKRLSGKCAGGLIELMVERQHRVDHSDRAIDSIYPSGSPFGASHASGRHTSYESGKARAGHRISDRLDP